MASKANIYCYYERQAILRPLEDYRLKRNNALRARISEAIKISEWSDLKEANRQLSDQINQVERIGTEHQHSISIVKRAKRNDATSYSYTCYMYAFDLMDHKALNAVACGSEVIYPRANLISFLIRDFLYELKPNEVVDDCIVVYFDKGKPIHAGKWRQGFVISKWGKYSHLWRHDIWELPVEYGNSVRFFSKLEGNVMEEAYRIWAESSRKAH